MFGICHAELARILSLKCDDVSDSILHEVLLQADAEINQGKRLYRFIFTHGAVLFTRDCHFGRLGEEREHHITM